MRFPFIIGKRSKNMAINNPWISANSAVNTSGWMPYSSGCCCRRNASAMYLVDFGANISIPTGGTVEDISIAIAVDGSTLPASSMIVTPAAVDEYFNVSRAINVPVWRGCCETVTVRNTSEQPIQVQNANIIFSRPDISR